ncbi:restriction endonuclease subunit S [Tenacibaculum finnmarkense]|uniref:Restriction endonuclease subunit S n=1 Tax=Tenacibaculum finnmarkense genomovar finnmarkense TaxID=1458503 RepID=A0AAP1WFX4_9FLAO|nr:restriction endonuclease subunit S [Tenacibaculum finnmarkense]MBE7652485.1 restriction endonuclease subunit S [Tenacibaculum finnmarkense genomovar finnmarkense]MBE7694705.1 restriction endonuclease subunit S [Tenacibaculum finnmarkense genomovar finnmarkense]MCD8427031.1 restriction endonuclease subunit S [Tenacibaculum finnmarkense genomovar finnmarkense]MCG8731166.1 restriction endonuclease subunit S [Tenacibaculum finnmarkense]MCG8752875.1 restriction endonuclease subunit S [Tenacibacu
MNRISLEKISKIINSGLTPLRSNKEYWIDGNIPWVKTEQLGDKYIYDSNEKITNYALQNTSIKLNSPNTLSIAMYGEGKTRGSVSILKNETTTNQACCNIFIDEEKADFEFVYYNIKTQYNNLRNLSSGVRKNLNSRDIKNFEILLPNLQIQKSIAKVLSDLDSKIEINNKINAALEAMAKTLYDYWFVQFDFPDKNGKPYKSSEGKMIFNEELKREIPVGWEVKKLINLCTRIGDGLHGTPKYVEKSDYCFINGNNLKNGFISTDNDTKKVSAQEYEKHFIELNNNSILLSINGTLGNLAIYNNEKVMLGKSSAYINCKENHRTYCYEYLNQSHMKKVFWNIATGSTIKNLGLESIKKLKILEPNNNLIEQFDELTKSIENKRINIFKQNQKLSELRDWLLPMLMNGQVRVGEK